MCVRNLVKGKGRSERDNQGREKSICFISLIVELPVYVSMCACGTTRKHCMSLDKSRHVARDRSVESPWRWQSEEEERAFVRTHVEMSIDLDEIVAGENDSLTQQRKQEHRGVREYEDNSEPRAF